MTLKTLETKIDTLNEDKGTVLTRGFRYFMENLEAFLKSIFFKRIQK